MEEKTAIPHAFIRAARFATEVVSETLWPTRCAVCDAPGEVLCGSCRAHLRFVDVNDACPRCGAPYGRLACTECNSAMMESAGLGRLPLDGMAHVLLADDAAMRIVRVYKDAGERRLALEMARLLARYLPPEWEGGTLTFIPATEDAFRRRGFDHGELLARQTARVCGLESAALFARPGSADQRTFDRHGRLRNMGGRFQLLPGVSLPSEVIILDDVCTTGATLFAAAACLKEASSVTVRGLTFAKVLAS